MSADISQISDYLQQKKIDSIIYYDNIQLQLCEAAIEDVADRLMLLRLQLRRLQDPKQGSG